MKITKLQGDFFIMRKLAEELNIPLFIAQILVNRGYTEPHKLLDFILAENKMSDPFGLPDMKKLCERVTKAIQNEEQITICGDYDVDGTLATTILIRYLRAVGAKVNYFIPHRTLDGYGISDVVMRNLKDQFDTKVAISVDTGTTAFDAANEAIKLGMDLIVTDHHNLSPEGIPPVYALINAKRPGCDPKYQILAGSGVAYYIIRALNIHFVENNLLEKPVNENDYLVLAMMASIADVVPLVDDNRVITKYGLMQLPYSKIEGLEALFNVLNLKNVTSKDIGWRFAPVINAAGRLGSANQALDLFLETNRLQATLKAQDLIALNQKRQKLSKEINEHALKEADKIVADRNPSIIVVGGNYHVGVIGIAAAKIVDKYRRPAIVIGFDETGYGKASARSVAGISVKDAIDVVRSYHLGGGGHDMAAGFSINKDQLEKFSEEIEKYLKTQKPKEAELVVEAELLAEEIDRRAINMLGLMEPFGQNNLAPVVQINNLKVSEKNEIRGGNILYIFENEIRGLIFNPTTDDLEFEDPMFNAVGELSIQNGQVQFIIKKILK